MDLNNLQPTAGARKARKRVGRGIGSTLGKTCGRGHNGQKSRSGGFHKLGFEGGQMPIQRRLPKQGFSSRVGLVTEQIRLGELNKIEEDTIDLNSLKAHGLVNKNTKYIKVFLSGEINRAVTLKGLPVTKGVQAAIEKQGGKVEE